MQNLTINNHKSPHHTSLHQQFILPQNQLHNHSIPKSTNSTPSSNPQINYKINRTLKKSLLTNKILHSTNHHTLTDPDSSTQPRLSHQKQKLQIFSVPNSISNHSKLNPTRKSTNQNFSHRKLFPQEEEFLNELKQKTKIKSSRNFCKSLINSNLQNNFANLQNNSLQKNNGKNDIDVTCISSQKGNRSKTLDVQDSNASEALNPLKRQRNYLFFKKSYERQQCENLNKFYQKFENFCKKENQEKTYIYNEFKPVQKNPSQQKSDLLNKNSFRQKIEERMMKLKDKKCEKRKTDKQAQQRKKAASSNPNSIPQQNKERLSSKAQSRLKVLVKSNSNNHILRNSNKKVSSKNSQQKDSQKFDKIKEKDSKDNKSQQTAKFFFSWKGQRIHQQDKIQESTSYLLRSQSNINKKKPKYSPFQKSMKINNNMHIVITQNNKTKINVFHNSMLLKEDPQKVDALAALVRQASENAKPQKISFPAELEINKLSIIQKSSPNSVKNTQKKANEQIKQIVKNLKGNRKSPIQKMKTQRKYQFRMQDVQPWDIIDQKNIQDSKQLFNTSFYYCNSKTIV